MCKHLSAIRHLLFLFALFILYFATGDLVAGQDKGPDLTPAQRRLLVQQKKLFFSGFKSIESFSRASGAPGDVQRFYRGAGVLYNQLRKPVPVGLGYLQKAGDWTHLLNVEMKPIESLANNVYHVQIGEEHVAINLEQISVVPPLDADWVVPFLVVRLERVNFLVTRSGKPVHYAVPIPLTDIPKGYFDEGRLMELGEQPMLILVKQKQ